MINKKILIVGDSWGCGEWNTYGSISHPGLFKYLRKYFIVNNVSEPLANTFEICQQLKDNIQFNYDAVIAFMAPPIRHGYKHFWMDESATYQDYIDRQNNAVIDVLEEMNTVCGETSIILLGGLQKLYHKWVEPYSNIKVAIPSIPEFIDDSITHHNVWCHDFVRNIPTGVYKKIGHYFESDVKCWDNARYNNNYYSDLAHPNRIIHKRIFRYLISNSFLLK